MSQPQQEVAQPVSTRMPYTYFAGQVIESEKAMVSPAAHTMQYGTNVFTGMRGYLREGKLRVFRLKAHFERLMRSAKLMGFDFNMEYEDFKNILAELIKQNKPTCELANHATPLWRQGL